jgi:hypothetical protein
MFAADLIIIDDVQILTPRARNRASMTLRSTSAHDGIGFGGKPILVVEDRWRLSPRCPFTQCLFSIGASQASLLGSQFENFQLQQLMRGQDPAWDNVLPSIVDGQTQNM